jgi:RimJ/RimL family protein N-acetyltransferase
MISNLLRGQRVRLNALDKPDIPVLALWEEDLIFLRLFNSNLARPRSEAALAEWVDQINKSQDEIVFAIRLIEDNKLIGILGFHGLEWANQVAWLSLGIGDPGYWGQGYGYEATQLALAYAFGELNLHRLNLTVLSYNTRAIKLYEKCGFKCEGVFRQYLQRDGQRYDMYLYGLLRQEWIAHPPS